MNVYLISLEKSIGKRQKLMSAFPNSYKDFNIINGVVGNELTATKYFNYTRYYSQKFRKLMTPGEVGCSLSHMQALEKIVDSKTCGLILEDDVQGNEQSFLDLKRIETQIGDWDFYLLGTHPASKLEYILCESTVFSEKVYKLNLSSLQFIYGAHCYVVGYKLAEHILENQKKFLLPADIWPALIREPKVQIYFTNLFEHPVISKENSSLESDRAGIRYERSYLLLFYGLVRAFKMELLRIKIRCERIFLNKKSILKQDV